MSKITTIINNIYKEKYGYEKYEEPKCDQVELLAELLRVNKLDDENLYTFCKTLGKDFNARDLEGLKKFIYCLHGCSCKIPK